jgi:hypothetical protein
MWALTPIYFHPIYLLTPHLRLTLVSWKLNPTRRQMKRLAKAVQLAVLTMLGGCTTSYREPIATNAVQDQYHHSTLAYDRVVGIEVTTNGVTSSGGGVWLGNGEVLTATHIFSGVKSPSDPMFVTWRGDRFKAVPIFHGVPPDTDLILLKVDQALVSKSLARVPAPQVCADVAPIGKRLYVTARDRTYTTYASPAGSIRFKDKTWSNSTTALLSHGVSGSPVYDDDTGCLAGIVSRMELGLGANLADPKQGACERATLQMADSHQGGTCAIEPRSVFMTSDQIQRFLKEANEYKRTQTN